MANTAAQQNSASPLGFGLSCTYCTCVLPQVDPVTGVIYTAAVTTIQPPLGLGTNPTTGKVLPSVTSGRPLLSESLVRRYATPRGALPDVIVPTTLGAYGVDILDSVDADMTPTDAGMLASELDAQAQQDERVITTTTSATLVNDTLIIGQVITDGTGPFKQTLAIDTLANNLSVLSAPT
jgi:hypothetical protein